MAASIVNGKLVNPTATYPASGTVTVTLVDFTDTPVIGFNVSEETEIISTVTVTPNVSGAWTASLVPNAGIALRDGTTGTTAYRVVESGASSTYTYWILVTAFSPVWTGAILTQAVAPALPSTNGNANVTGDLTVGGNLTVVGDVVGGSVPSSRLMIAGTGLTGGGDLSDDRTFAVAYGTTAGTAAQGNDTRIVGAVQSTRAVNTGTGLTGGGDLSAHRTLSVVPNTTVQQVQVARNGTVVGARSQINLVPGSGQTIIVADNAASDRLDITFGTTGGSGGNPAYDNYVAPGTSLATLNALISNLNATGGGRIIMGPGVHTFSGSIVLKSNVTLFGVGMATIINQTATNVPCFTSSGQLRYGIEKMYVTGPGQGVGTGKGLEALKGVRPDVQRLTIRDVIFADFGGNGIDIENEIVSEINNVTVQTCGGKGIYLRGQPGGAAGTSVHLTTFYANGNTGIGIHIFKMTYFNLSACASDSNSVPYRIEECQGGSVDGCGFEAHVGSGYEIIAGTHACNATFTACWSFQATANVFKLTGGAKATLLGCSTNTPVGGAARWINCDATSKAIDIGSDRAGLVNAGTTANITTINFP